MNWSSYLDFQDLSEMHESKVSDRCDISPIESLRELDFPLDGDRPRKMRRRPHRVSYSTAPAPTPSWMSDPTLLPKKPPRCT